MGNGKLSRRACLQAGAGLLAGLMVGGAWAQSSYAQRPVRLIVPFAAGGAIDSMARKVGESLGRELGQPVIVENKPGAAGNIGAAQVAKSAPDGYTLLVGTSATHGANPALFKKMQYDAVADFEPISLWGFVPNVLVVNAEKGHKNLNELVAAAKANPGGLGYGSAGTGTSLHLAGILFEKAADVKLMHVPYKGGAPASLDLLGGNIPMMFDTITVSLPNLKAGKLRAFAVSAPERHFALPDVPTFAELGYKGVEAGTWAGVFAPRGTPAPILAELNQVFARVLKDPAVMESMRVNGVQIMSWQGEKFRGYVNSEIKHWGQVIRDANISIE